MLTRIDTALFNLVNDNCSNGLLDLLMPLVTDLGEGVFVAIVSISIILIAKRSKKVSALLLLAGLTLTYYAVLFLKNLIGRPRPFDVIPSVHLLVKAGQFSFPSGHTAVAFMSAFILTRYFKRGAVFFALASLVGFSRVYVGVHFVSDVLAGAAIGTLIGYLLVRAAKGIEVSG